MVVAGHWQSHGDLLTIDAAEAGQAARVSNMRRTSLQFLGMLAIALAALSAAAPVAMAQVVLTLSRGPGNAEILEFSLDDLRAMPQVTIVTENEFIDGKAAYRGPLVRDVLEQLALDRVDTIRLIAVNDYYVDIPTRDFLDYDAILALEVDGKPLSRRDKGPIWLMYPISDHAELREHVYVNRLIWQVYRIEAL